MARRRSEAEIRKAVEADLQALVTLILRAFADVREQQSGEVLARIWADWEANHVPAIDLSSVILAEVAGTAAGFATYGLNDATRIGTVSDNAVLPEYRGQGIGGQLLNAVLSLMEQAGMEFAQVSTGLEESYAPARRMYERQGFKPLCRSILYGRELAQHGEETSGSVAAIIRRAGEADRETLVKLIVRAFADVTVLRWREEQFGIIGGRGWEEWEADLMRAIDIEHVTIAEVSGKAVGFATYELDHATRIGNVSDNAVLPQYRGRGIGGRLLERVLGLMEEAGMEYAQVSTGLEDGYAPARRMYERQGFKPIHRSVLYMMQLSKSAM